MLTYSLRKANLTDLEPMMRLGHEALRPYIEGTQGWNQTEQEQGFIAHFEIDKIQIIQFEAQDVGYIKLDKTKETWFLEGIYIAQKLRGRGLGSAVLQAVLQEAKAAQRVIKLQVFRINPALNLYTRLGFQIEKISATHVFMYYDAQAVSHG